MLDWLLSWEVSSVVVGVCISIALGVLALNDYKLAKIFFLLAACDAIGGVSMGATKWNMPSWATSLTVFLMSGLIGLLLLQSLLYVDGKRDDKDSKPTETKPDNTSQPLKPPAQSTSSSSLPPLTGTNKPKPPTTPHEHKAEPGASRSTEGPEENTSALKRPYFSNTGNGGFTNDEPSKTAKLTIKFMNNSLHSAFDLRTRFVLMQQDDFTIRAVQDTSLAGEIAPFQTTKFFWRTPEYVGTIPDMPAMYVIFALQYSGQPDLSQPEYGQMFYMKWAGITNGVVASETQYVEIEERDKLLEKIEEHNLNSK
jgi:hypothetical protein